ncbi:MAG: hypothetical protein H0T92_24015 [Pyrinomonadaceae bacterium]|nr:hypothetical protein [Pyrinomonadaceae bacterium]
MGIISQQAKRLSLSAFVLTALALLVSACGAASRPPDPAQPRADVSAYPVVFTGSEERREQAIAAWQALVRDQGILDAPLPEFQPITATVRALPTQLAAPLRLPKIGSEATFATEEESREALRRFISSANALLGVEAQELSLVEHKRAVDGDGAQQVRYQQRPFNYPLRGGYGELTISFTPDRRVIELSSTGIPDATRLERALDQIRPRLTREQAVARLANQTFTHTDAAGQPQTRTLRAGDETAVRELVVYPVIETSGTPRLELRLAWEIAVGPTSAAQIVYLDAATGEIIAAPR